MMAWILILCLVGGVASAQSERSLAEMPPRVLAAERANPCSFNIATLASTRSNFVFGSGTVIDLGPELGVFGLTNAHVVDGADQIIVYRVDPYADGVQVQVVGADFDRSLGIGRTDLSDVESLKRLQVLAGADLALLRLPEPLPEWLAPALIGSSESLLVGDDLIAVGNPTGIGSSVSEGIVSALVRCVDVTGAWIQNTAKISPGNSGGGLFNLKGELVGVNTMKHMGRAVEGIGLAIPVELALDVGRDLARYGRVRRAFFGVKVTDTVEAGVPAVEIREIREGSHAEQIGVLPGDIIRAVEGVRVLSAAEFIEASKRFVADRSYTIEVLRSGEPLLLEVRTATWPKVYQLGR